MPLHIGSALRCSERRIGVGINAIRTMRLVAVSWDRYINAVHQLLCGGTTAHLQQYSPCPSARPNFHCWRRFNYRTRETRCSVQWRLLVVTAGPPPTLWCTRCVRRNNPKHWTISNISGCVGNGAHRRIHVIVEWCLHENCISEHLPVRNPWREIGVTIIVLPLFAPPGSLVVENFLCLTSCI